MKPRNLIIRLVWWKLVPKKRRIDRIDNTGGALLVRVLANLTSHGSVTWSLVLSSASQREPFERGSPQHRTHQVDPQSMWKFHSEIHIVNRRSLINFNKQFAQAHRSVGRHWAQLSELIHTAASNSSAELRCWNSGKFEWSSLGHNPNFAEPNSTKSFVLNWRFRFTNSNGLRPQTIV